MKEAEAENKYDVINIDVTINELMVQTEVTQYFKNTRQSPIELQMVIPKLSNNNLTKFEMKMNNQKVISKLIEKGKAKEKYTDIIAKGNYGFLSYSSKEETTICLGNIPPNEEIILKTYFFGHIITKDYSYQACFPVIFPGFILGDPKNEKEAEKYEYKKQIVKGKIYINTFSKLTRLVIKGSKNFGKIDKIYGKDLKSAKIDIYKDNFNEKDIPGIILFRTEEINKDKIFLQYDPNKDRIYYILEKTLEIPKFNLIPKKLIDEEENVNYSSLLKGKDKDKKNTNKKCYIFLLDQSGSMSGESIELCKKALLLFLQSLNEDFFFQLIGFGSNYEYYTSEPLEYNTENIKKLTEIIKNLDADKGGTELFSPLNNIYNNKIYEKFDMVKNIFLLTDGEICQKEETLNLIGSHSDKFSFHSIGIGYCDKDLIERSALIGNGYSYFIDNLENLNKIIISALEKSQTEIMVKCGTNLVNNIQDKNQKYIKLNDFFRHGIILDKDNDIIYKIKYNKIEQNISSKKIYKILLPNGDELGKLIIDKYLEENKSIDFRTKIKLSKDYSILCSETAFYAEIQNEVPITEKMTTLTNKNKEAKNNNNNSIQETESESDSRNDFKINDKKELEENIEKKPKKGFFSYFYSIFACKREKNIIINKKEFKYDEEEKEKKEDEKIEIDSKVIITSQRILSENEFDEKELQIKRKVHNSKSCKKKKKGDHLRDCAKDNNYDQDCIGESNYDKDCKGECDYNLKEECEYSKDSCSDNKECSSDNKKCKKKKKSNSKEDVSVLDKKDDLNFEEIISNQDFIEGNWKKDNKSESLISQEKDLYEKIKNFSQKKGISNEDAIITLFIICYIFDKKREKVEELKFVIDKAKNYIKKIFNLEYDVIEKELK